MAERTHWWIERWLSVSPFLSLFLSFSLCLSFAIYLQSYLSSHLPIYLSIHISIDRLFIHLSIKLSIFLSIHLPHKTTSERPKCLRDPQFLTLLTSKCASRHNGVHFFDISTSKSAPRPPVFNTFYFQMCFVPQRRALFRHLNCQNCSEPLSF